MANEERIVLVVVHIQQRSYYTLQAITTEWIFSSSKRSDDMATTCTVLFYSVFVLLGEKQSQNYIDNYKSLGSNTPSLKRLIIE